MYYKPHILFLRKQTPIANDEFGRPVKRTEEEYVNICPCRCDDNTKAEVVTSNGQAYVPSYHIVCEGSVKEKVREGEYIRVQDLHGAVRAEGIVAKLKNLNLLNYSEVWI